MHRLLVSARKKVLMFYGHSLGRFELMDIDFLGNLRTIGLAVSEVSDDDDVVVKEEQQQQQLRASTLAFSDAAEPCTGIQALSGEGATHSGDRRCDASEDSNDEDPLMELFPELRPVVFHIRVDSAGTV
jgi:hypothetical protein